MTSPPKLRALGEVLLGTEALGIDLSIDVDEATFAWIRRSFAEHPVLVFRNQNLGAAELTAFGRRFGSPRTRWLVKYRHAECPEVSWLTNVEDDGKVDWYGVKRATDWHTDSTAGPGARRDALRRRYCERCRCRCPKSLFSRPVIRL